MSKQKQAQLRKSVQPFAKPDTIASIKQLINTILPFVILWFLAYKSLSLYIWLLTVSHHILSSQSVICVIIILHDCTLGSIFRNVKDNRLDGTQIGIITLFAFEKWNRNHFIHHAT